MLTLYSENLNETGKFDYLVVDERVKQERDKKELGAVVWTRFI